MDLLLPPLEPHASVTTEVARYKRGTISIKLLIIIIWIGQRAKHMRLNTGVFYCVFSPMMRDEI
jgi:hypothetical protein